MRFFNISTVQHTLIEVVLPLAFPKVITYGVPESLLEQVKVGVRVEVPLRNKLYSGIIISLEGEANPIVKTRSIVSVIDAHPIISQSQIKFWKWMAAYYSCTVGEVMNVALPAGLKLSSETKLILNPAFENSYLHLDDKEYLIAEAIHIQNELTIDQVKDILNQQTVYPHIRKLIEEGILYIKEELKQKYKAKEIDYISFEAKTNAKDFDANFWMDKVKRSEKQSRALLYILQRSQTEEWIKKSEIYKEADIDSASIAALKKKGIIKIEKRAISRLSISDEFDDYSPPKMSELQTDALADIRSQFVDRNQVLLFGVTGSGKTRVYIELIKEYIEKGQQVLYLLPEIALTTQLVGRLRIVFGDTIGVYHSKMNNSQRVELWKSAKTGAKLFIGARSSLFLPFSNLGLVIVDEEHDPSYKQSDPAPRYHARDASIYLASLYKAKVLMGTATPALESFQNTKDNKYGLVKMLERFGASVLPEIKIVDLKDRYQKGLMKSVYSRDLLDAIQEALSAKEQVLIFQNRRGFAPTIQCNNCDWHAGCPNCDVSLTKHKYFKELRCHYCGYKAKIPDSCPSCGLDQINDLGFGTEKIEDELAQLIPEARIDRLDYDTAKTKKAFESILESFGAGEIDILVGTQMITKGLDFDKIAVVGILQADKMLFFPDFRAHERAFQLLTQVSGRAGRREKRGKVIVQTFNPEHPVIQETVNNNVAHFYARELEERKKFRYPPFVKLIEITLKHKDPRVVEEAARILHKILKDKLFNRVFGPSVPGISRIRGFYIQNILVKIEKDVKVLRQVKRIVNDAKLQLLKMEKKGSVRINIDVDP